MLRDQKSVEPDKSEQGLHVTEIKKSNYSN